MNRTAVGYLVGLQDQIQRADMVSFQTVSWSVLDEALALIVRIPAISHAELRAKRECSKFRHGMVRAGLMPLTPAVEQAREDAVSALGVLRDLVAIAKASKKAVMLHTP